MANNCCVGQRPNIKYSSINCVVNTFFKLKDNKQQIVICVIINVNTQFFSLFCLFVNFFS
jgi:hypothetical protein